MNPSLHLVTSPEDKLRELLPERDDLKAALAAKEADLLKAELKQEFGS